MANEFMVVRNALRNLQNESKTWANLSPFGDITNMSWIDALILAGYGYHVQVGTEDAPVASTTSIDDQLVWALVDVPTGKTIIPIYAEVVTATWTTATLINMMLEIDPGKVRYSSGGSAFAPLNMNTGCATSSGCNAYVGTDVTVAAKSTTSMEIARLAGSEDNVGTSTGAENHFKFNAKERGIHVIKGPGSFLVHYGAASADVTGYGCFQFLAFDSTHLS
jgi:hypothetical protein